MDSNRIGKTTTPLKVTIIGAGLAGTIAGRVLREKHDVTILERFLEGHELGAAINIGPCAVKILQELGFDKARVGSITAEVARTFDKHGKKLQEIDMSAFSRMAGAPWVFQHRADLWNEFYSLATSPSEELGIQGNPCKVIWGAVVVSVDVDTGDVTLADGTKIESDLVIGADGIKSVTRHLVVGEDEFATARPSGSSAYRFTIPVELARQANLAEFRVMDSTKPASLDVYISLDKSNMSIVMYPCRDYKLINLVCIAPDTHINAKTTESWSASGSREDLLDTFKEFSYCKPLLQRAENIKLWQLRDQDPLPTYIKGRTVLIGDAAHAMTPHQGQGGTQAVEDAEAFRLFNTSNVGRDGVAAILQDFDRVRRKRASQIQNNTREAHSRKSAETLYKHTKYNWTYPGIHEALGRLNSGKDMIPM